MVAALVSHCCRSNFWACFGLSSGVTQGKSRMAQLRGYLSRRLEQLDGIAVGILDLNLLAARTSLHVVSKIQASFLQGIDEPGKIADPKHDTIPSARFLLLAVRHRSRSRRLWAAEQNVHVAERDIRKRGKLLVSER